MAIFDVSIGTNDPAYRVGDFISFGEGMTLNAEEYAGFLRDLQEAVDPDEGWGNLLRPVFIVIVNQGNAFSKFGEAIKKYTPARDGSKETHWHAAMGFGPNLKHLYSFSNGHEEAGNNKRKGGLAFESIEFYKKWYAPTATMQVSCILLAKENFAKVKETLEYYIKNKEKTSYLALGQKAAFFMNTDHFVNIVEGGGMIGYEAVLRTLKLMREAYLHEQDMRSLVQIKGLGCEVCVTRA